MANNFAFSIGSLVTNFGVIAEVLDIDPLRGVLLREVSTLSHQGCGKWYADPRKCEPYGSTRSAHADGLVVFD